MNAFRLSRVLAGACLLGVAAVASAHPLQLDVPLQTSGSPFGSVTVLPNGNIVIVDSNYGTAATPQVGAVFVLRPDGTMLSMLKGAQAGDAIGSDGIRVLANGNFVVQSSNWRCTDSGFANCGAATWVDARYGLSGDVGASNSLVGVTGAPTLAGGDQVGRQVFALRNGDYVVRGTGVAVSPGFTGTLTRGNGVTGTSGAVTSANSLIGANQGDLVGDSVLSLPNGAIVITSRSWNASRGAVTHVAANQPLHGMVTAVNSLVGSRPGDGVGTSMTVLSNGNYVVCSPYWSAGAGLLEVGAATWVGANAPLTGALSAASSLVGAQSGDQVCSGGVAALEGNGNYVVASRRYKNGAAMVGAATWGDGGIGVRGVVSSTNSLVGFGGSGTVPMPVSVTPLRGNGNYVVAFAAGSHGSLVSGDSSGVAPVVWANGSSGVTGVVSSGMASYVSTSDTQLDATIVPLENGHYAVGRTGWNGGVGAVHWGNGTAGGPFGLLSASIALTGTTAGDNVGFGGVIPLRGGNHAVMSPMWSGNAGAVTRVGGAGPWVGQVSAANSLVGPQAGSRVGSGGVVALENGNYLIGSPEWDTAQHRGGWTWGDGSSATSGVIGISNTVIGITADDRLGNGPMLAVSTGAVLALAPSFDVAGIVDAGAACEYGGTGAISGGPNQTYCVIGSSAGSGASWQVAAASSGDFWLVFRPAERLLSLVGVTDRIFSADFD